MEQLDMVGLLRASQLLEKKVSVALMYSGLRVPQFRALEVIAEYGQATVTEIASKLHVTRASASTLVNELIKSEIVATVPNPSDRRSFHVQMTELGAKKLYVARNDIRVLNNELSRKFPVETIAVVNRFATTVSGR